MAIQGAKAASILVEHSARLAEGVAQLCPSAWPSEKMITSTDISRSMCAQLDMCVSVFLSLYLCGCHQCVHWCARYQLLGCSYDSVHGQLLSLKERVDFKVT